MTQRSITISRNDYATSLAFGRWAAEKERIEQRSQADCVALARVIAKQKTWAFKMRCYMRTLQGHRMTDQYISDLVPSVSHPIGSSEWASECSDYISSVFGEALEYVSTLSRENRAIKGMMENLALKPGSGQIAEIQDDMMIHEPDDLISVAHDIISRARQEE